MIPINEQQKCFKNYFLILIQRVFHVQTKAYIYYDKDKIYKID